jgi:hypothetical protein
MRRPFIVLGIILLVQIFALSAFAQQDKLIGKWEGKIQSPQGERPTTMTFKKEGDVITGKMPDRRAGVEIELKDVKVEGNKVTAKANVESPQGAITINYTFTLEGDTLNGQGNVDVGGQNFTFDINLKRAAGDAASAPPAQPAQQPAAGAQQPGQAGGQTGGPGGQGGRGGRTGPPQPQQKQSIDYFIGTWGYRYVGRESAFGPAPRECTVTFTKRADGKSAEGVTTCKGDSSAFKNSMVITFDEATKMMTFSEKLNGGVAVNSKGDWTSPIAIRFTIDPVKVKGQTLQLRRVLSVVAAHSFTVAEELSEDGGPFVRLGSAVFSKVNPQ